MCVEVRTIGVLRMLLSGRRFLRETVDCSELLLHGTSCGEVCMKALVELLSKPCHLRYVIFDALS